MIKKLFQYSLLIPALAVSCSCDVKDDTSGSVKKGGLIPRSVLLSKPDRFCVSMNYDGTKISYLARNGDKVKLVITDANQNIIREFDVKESVGMFDYHWAYTGNHILIYQDNDGDENDNIICLDIASGERKNLTNLTKKTKAYVLAMSEDHPNEIRICTNERDPTMFDIYSLNIETGQRDKVFENNENWAGFILDDDYKIRFMTKILPDGSTEYFSVNDKGEYEHFLKVPYCDSKSTGLGHLSKDGKILYGSTSINRDKSAVIAYDLEKKNSKILFESDKADAYYSNCSPTTYAPRICGVNYLKPEKFAIDLSVESDLVFLKEKFKDEPFGISSCTKKDDVWLIGTAPVDKSGQYFLYIRGEKPELKLLFSSKPELDKYELQKMEPVVIKSRDGLDLVCYLTKARNFEKQKEKKLVLLIHGGPWARDGYSKHPWAQLLANRGYSVLQINYRGSTGFGKNFMNAIDRNLEKMNLDLIDGVNWAIENKIADKDKIAIMGGSFGGYSTLAGLTFFSDVFCCGVDFCGPSNWVTTIKSNPPYWAQFAPLEHKTYGNPDDKNDLEYLNKISPYNYSDQISKPLMVVQGVNDPRVVQKESDQIVSILKGKNKPVAYVLYENEGHSLMMDNNRKSSLAFAERFLAKFLGGEFEPLSEQEKAGATYKILEGKDLVE